jgi:hypothetical protein
MRIDFVDAKTQLPLRTLYVRAGETAVHVPRIKEAVWIDGIGYGVTMVSSNIESEFTSEPPVTVVLKRF